MMKKAILLIGLASVMSAFTGCSKDEAADSFLTTPADAKKQSTLLATMGSEQTRTQMGDNSAVWSQGDQIALYASISSSQHFLPFAISAADAGNATASFTLDSEFQAGWDSKEYYPMLVPNLRQCVAIYPSSSAYYNLPSNNASSLLRLGATIPTTQQYKKGSFDNGALPMIATCTETEVGPEEYTYSPLNFKYMGALVKLQLAVPEATTLEKIELVGGNAVAGRIHIDFAETTTQTVIDGLDGTGASIGVIDSNTLRSSLPSTTITLNGPIELDNTSVNDIYFVVLPQSYTGNFTFRFYVSGDSNNPITKSVAASKLNAGEIASIPVLNLVAGNAPQIDIDGGNVATWAALENAKSYSARILDTDDQTLATRNNLDPQTGIDLAALDLNLARGNHGLKLELTVQFSDRLDATATVPFTYYSGGITPTASYNGDASTITISNWAANYVAGQWEKVDYAYVAGSNVDLTQFDSAQFTETTAASFATGDLAGGTYTFLIRAWYDTTDTENGYKYTRVNVTVVVYPIKISASVSGHTLTIVIEEGADLITNIGYVTVGFRNEVDQKGVAMEASNWNAATSTITMDIMDLCWDDDGTYMIQIGIFDWGTFEYILSNAVSVEFVV